MGEIFGILKNGIDRGWQLDEIKRSLINAGYSSKEVETEIQTFQTLPTGSKESNLEQKYNPQNLSNYQIGQTSPTKKKSVLIYVITAIVSLVIIGAVVFFLTI